MGVPLRRAWTSSWTSKGCLWTVVFLGILLMGLSGCARLRERLGEQSVQTYIFALQQSHQASRVDVNKLGAGPVLEVSAPQARAGYDSPRMVYIQRPYELNYYAHNEWADGPARMLWPLLVKALEASGRFSALVDGPKGVLADLRLDTEIMNLQNEVDAQRSQGRVVLRAQLIELGAHRVLGTQTFEAVEPAPSADPYGGVAAINRALARVLEEIVEFCVALTESERVHSRR